MIAPLIDSAALGNRAALYVALPVGIAFGFALERAGLGNARKLAAQFTLRDLTVLKVLFSALLTAMLGAFWLGRLGLLDLERVYVPETFLGAQALGGVIFGVGFVLAGLCPGTACVSAASGRGDGLAAVFGMLFGVFATAEVLPWLAGLYQSGARGALTIPALLGLPYGVIVLVVTAAALSAFTAAAVIERRHESAQA
jgi:uncharacterized membrane protein YedE/YeeE